MALVPLLAGCAPAGGAPAGPELTAASSYGRHAAVQHRVHLYIANRGPGRADVETVQVRHPLFEPVPPTERASSLPADGAERMVPVPFGRPRCDATDPAGAVVVLGVRGPDGVRDTTVPLVDREPGLLRAHRIACAAAAVEAVASVALGPAWEREQSPDGPRLRTTLRLQRRAPGSVTVTDVLGSILFTPTAADLDPVLALPAGQDAAQTELVVAATRCDQHARIESKTSFTFPVFASVDGAEPVRLSVTAPLQGRAALQRLLDDACGAQP